MTRRAAISLAVLAIVAGLAGALLGTPWDTKSTQSVSNTASANGQDNQNPPAVDSTLSIVATAAGPSVSVFSGPGGSVTSTLPNPIQSGAPLTFLLRERKDDWLHVLLPLRPNGSEGWIKLDQVHLTSHHFKITVHLADHRVTVTNGDAVLLDTPAGIGKADTPTPGGLYYTKELMQPPNPNGAYGHFAYGLSGYSNVLTEFAGGDGVIGIHGTNDPAGLGKDVSHGCIRISNDAIDLLARTLPLGVPVEIDP